MTPTPPHADYLERSYALALHLYPARFREAHGQSMRQVFHDALRDHVLSRRTLIPLVLRDLITSLAKEHLTMLRDTFLRPALVFNALILAGISTVLALALYVIPLQVLRLGADDPQVELAGNLTWQLEQGASPEDIVPGGTVELTRSLSPFVAAFDEQGHPLASQARLNGQLPTLPPGVLNYVRQHGEDRFTWRPIQGVRIAAVVQRVGGPHPGFVLAGRSMREEASRQGLVKQLAELAWIAMLGLIFMGTLAFGWYTRQKPA
jgi:hypothetical protein